MTSDGTADRPPEGLPVHPEGTRPDPRTREQFGAEKAAAAAQSAALTDRITPHSVVDEMLQALEHREGGGGAPPPDVLQVGGDGPSGRQVLVARGEVLVRADATPLEPRAFLGAAPVAGGAREPEDSASRADTALAARGYSLVSEDERTLRAPGLRRYVADRPAAQVWEDVLAIRADLQLPASPHYLLALGHVIKGLDHPALTATRPTLTPEQLKRYLGTTPVPVAVIDTGITPEDRRDGWLTGIPRADATDPLTVTSDGWLESGAGHGTFTAGVVEQVAPGAQVTMYAAASDVGFASDLDVAAALLRAAAHGARIINVSIGGSTADDTPPIATEAAIHAIQRDYPETLIIASAGNNGTSVPVYPAAQKQVVAVGALNADRTPAEWSSFGHWVDCSAVGVGVASTFVPGVEPPNPGGTQDSVFGPDAWALWSGTSFAAPQITGAVADYCQLNAGMTPVEALQLLFARVPRYQAGYGWLVHLLPGTPTA